MNLRPATPPLTFEALVELQPALQEVMNLALSLHEDVSETFCAYDAMETPEGFKDCLKAMVGPGARVELVSIPPDLFAEKQAAFEAGEPLTLHEDEVARLGVIRHEDSPLYTDEALDTALDAIADALPECRGPCCCPLMMPTMRYRIPGRPGA